MNISYFRPTRLLSASKNFNIRTITSKIKSDDGSALGFIGLGHMGSKMVQNLAKDGRSIIVYDKDENAMSNAIKLGNNISSGSIELIRNNCKLIFSMLPNDKIVKNVSEELLASSKLSQHPFLHISCSTISPETARYLTTEHSKLGQSYVSSPVFARPDGLAKRQATWMISGEENDRQIASELLRSSGNIVELGNDAGAANVVKLCGNFLIAASIESIAESMVLAEKHGVDRTKVMEILSSSIFDCLIYKGYGQRVSKRDHRPGGFSLALGTKDVSLVQQAAREVNAPMPFLSVLLDRYVSATAKGRADFDWSAIGLSVAEDAGIDVSEDVKRNQKDIEDKNYY
eukprot:gene7328-9988_t